jgi:hypothetical protein
MSVKGAIQPLDAAGCLAKMAVALSRPESRFNAGR